jgi:acetylglutamate kinase
MKSPKGFYFSGINCGIKAARKDMALVYSEAPCAAAGCFTVNATRAAPVRDAAARLPATGIRAIVVNSGNANALTGPHGEEDVRAVAAAVGRALGVDGKDVLCASTGVIGVRLPVHKLVDAAPQLVAARGTAVEQAAEAILTTDTRVKLAGKTVKVGDARATIAAFAKGSGMIAPELATMLCFITTDAAVDPQALQTALSRAMDRSFNAITVDDDMSTNDAVFALANGMLGNEPLTTDSPSFPGLAKAIEEICMELARAIAEDGEGATKLLEVRVSGAPTDDIARELAKCVSGSSLVKAAMFGADPNWGRVLSAIGARVGSKKYAVDPVRATVTIQGIVVYADGAPTGADPIQLRAKMREPQIVVEVALSGSPASVPPGKKVAPGSAVSWGCDLSYDYVKINADYTSLTSASPDGTVTRDDRLTNYSPGFKRALLVEALSYISRFTGRRAVVKYGGAAMVKDSLKASFANDIKLLRSAGLLPIVVHGGGPEITHTLKKLGNKQSEFVDGIRVTAPEEVKVVEMVLTGKINTEIVSLLNQGGFTAAVGVSGKDAGLLRAKKLLGEGGRDLGMVGEVVQVNAEYIQMFLDKGYVPIISPVGIGEDGEGYNINADTAAAEIAVSIKADKLIYLTDVAGILEQGELVSTITGSALRDKIAKGTVSGGMVQKAKSALSALDRGVSSVHIIDGRTPHSVIAELFTDKGVGTLVTRD